MIEQIVELRVINPFTLMLNPFQQSFQLVGRNLA